MGVGGRLRLSSVSGTLSQLPATLAWAATAALHSGIPDDDDRTQVGVFLNWAGLGSQCRPLSPLRGRPSLARAKEHRLGLTPSPEALESGARRPRIFLSAGGGRGVGAKLVASARLCTPSSSPPLIWGGGLVRPAFLAGGRALLPPVLSPAACRAAPFP